VSELWEVSRMSWSCVSVRDCECQKMWEWMRVFQSCAGFVVVGSECQETWE
jgi:hypothetical protein